MTDTTALYVEARAFKRDALIYRRAVAHLASDYTTAASRQHALEIRDGLEARLRTGAWDVLGIATRMVSHLAPDDPADEPEPLCADCGDRASKWQDGTWICDACRHGDMCGCPRCR